ncbi:hypothetical protein BVG16_13610 [Paenibacillus selenitireducens]|uniref:Site-specific integrase n=1 Tax=Paenibacillus selenitireducens TaxID=1324314 RepID=A0A1T2XCS3_9BACL|nr:site-specific integrase [Paenibacillus selenitireducens]OPA77486.1 hypothetical protein BVG16_13610 [Paenibacillus selenitireducens]
MGWVEKRNNGFRLVVDINDPFGKRKRKTKVVHTNSKRIAEKELVIFEAELMKNISNNIDMKKINFEHFVEQWMEMYVNVHLEKTTQQNYSNYIYRRILPVFKHMYLNDIETIHIVMFLNDMFELKNQKKPVGQATRVYAYRVLRSLFQKAKEWYNIDPNPMDNVLKPKENSSPNVDAYTEEESRQIMIALQSENIQFRTLITLAFTTGMRRGELLGLEWKHIDFENDCIHIKQSIPVFVDGKPHVKSPKTKGSIRIVAIPNYVTLELKEYKKVWDSWKSENEDTWFEEGDFLFCNIRYHKNLGMPLFPKTLRERWQDFIKIRNPHIRYIRFHDIRHTSVSILINRGIHAKIISERVGHSKIGTTMDVYGHLMRTAEAKAADTFSDVFKV